MLHQPRPRGFRHFLSTPLFIFRYLPQYPRTQADEPFEDETQWCATYEAQLQLPPGKQLIEIKLLSHNDVFPSLVLSDWEIEVS